MRNCTLRASSSNLVDHFSCTRRDFVPEYPINSSCCSKNNNENLATSTTTTTKTFGDDGWSMPGP